MNRYYLTIIADKIHLERGVSLPLAGFVAQRVVRAKDEAGAIQYAKIQLLKDWKISFNRDNKAGTPQLEIFQCSQINNPFKRLKLENDYLFYSTEDEKSEGIQKATDGFKHWFIIR